MLRVKQGRRQTRGDDMLGRTSHGANGAPIYVNSFGQPKSACQHPISWHSTKETLCCSAGKICEPGHLPGTSPRPWHPKTTPTGSPDLLWASDLTHVWGRVSGWKWNQDPCESLFRSQAPRNASVTHWSSRCIIFCSFCIAATLASCNNQDQGYLPMIYQQELYKMTGQHSGLWIWWNPHCSLAGNQELQCHRTWICRDSKYKLQVGH